MKAVHRPINNPFTKAQITVPSFTPSNRHSPKKAIYGIVLRDWHDEAVFSFEARRP